MIHDLKKYFGEDISCKKIDVQLKVPFILAKRELYRITMNGVSFVVIQTRKEETFGVVALKKQMNLYTEQLQCCVAFGFDRVTKLQRDALIKNKIPFISLPEQVYLPFFGIILSENLKKEKEINSDKMMPATQQLFLFLLYQKDGPILKSSAAEALGLTRTSITRASEQLLAMGLIEQEKVGKEIRMFRKYVPKEMFEAARPYLINPVQKKMALRTEDIKTEWLYAGESALSEYSMLNAPKIPEVAVYKGAIDKEDIREVEARWAGSESVVMVEFWKYNPSLFAKSNTVDPVSLVCSLVGCEDERVELAVEEMMEDLEW